MATPRKYRSKQQWQELIDQWQTSGLSAQQFCNQQDLGYANFCQWRKRLSEIQSSQKTQSSKLESEPSFIDLSALGTDNSESWHIVLSLGNGVELRLTQG